MAGRKSAVVVVSEENGRVMFGSIKAFISRAMEDGFTSGGGLGKGLPGSRRLVNEFAIESVFGKGTRVTITRWK